MAGMGTAAVKDKLLGTRQPQPDTNGGAPAIRGMLTGKKLAEASNYLKGARAALVNWTREVYANSDAIDMQLVHIQETLRAADQLEDLRAKLEMKASIFGV
jgi:hypothetical protein